MAFWFAVMWEKGGGPKKGNSQSRAGRKSSWLQEPVSAGDVTVAPIATNIDRGWTTSQAGATTNSAAQEGRSCDHHQRGPLHNSRDCVCLRPPEAPEPGQSWASEAHAISMCRMKKPSLYTQERTTGKASNLSKALWLASGTAKNQSQQSRPSSPLCASGLRDPCQLSCGPVLPEDGAGMNRIRDHPGWAAIHQAEHKPGASRACEVFFGKQLSPDHTTCPQESHTQGS